MSFFVLNEGTDRRSWLADRNRGVSATDVARIMTGGSHAWAALHREKLGGSTFRGNAYTNHGREREAAIAAWAASEFELTPSTALLARWADGDADLPFALDLATPDALALVAHVDGLRCVEFGEYKTTVHNWPTWADVPRRYFWQVVWQFHVTGADRCRFVFEPHEGFVPLLPEPRVFTIERADVLDEIERARSAVAEWRVADQVAVPEGLESLDALLQVRQIAKEAADAAAARVDEHDNAIRELLAKHGRLAVPFEGTGASVSWTGEPVVSRRFDSKAFAAKYPAAAARFTKTVQSRPRLTITARS